MSLLPGKFYLDDFFDEFAPMPRMGKFDMKCDIYEKGGNVHIELDVPGYNKDEIKLDVDDGILTIEATKNEEKEDEEQEREDREDKKKKLPKDKDKDDGNEEIPENQEKNEVEDTNGKE